ncbi:MAG: fatty-acid--CoA ligase [Colwellia sp.]|nr:MAG: fatty-acid--CoA ligase [Colwellia sp.]
MYYYQALQRNATMFGDDVGTSFGERERTWKEVELRVAKLAGALVEQGVEQKNHVAILAMNSDRYFEYYNAIPWIGGVVVPLNIRWSLKENIYSLENSESSVLFVDDAFLEMGKELAKQCEKIQLIIYMGEGETPENMLNYEQLIDNASALAPVKNDYNNLAGIFYTGGTTGFPKGVMLSHTNLWSSSIIVTAEIGLNVAGERYLHAAPMFHLADVGISYATVIGGLCQVFVPYFDANSVIEIIEQKKVNHVLLVPTMVTMMLATPTLSDANFSSLKHIIYGASPMPEGTLIAAMEKMSGVKFIQAYGQSELSPVISILPAKYHVLEGAYAGKLRSAGRAGYCLRVEIRDENGTVLPTGKVGEIVASGPNTMLGYWKSIEQTAATLIDGWVLTGDAGYMDEDGFIFLVDRLKDMIVTGGENVFSIEVENALSHHSAIQESVVLGIPSKKWGESVHAIIRLNEGQEITDEEIRSHCREYIASYKIPHSIEIRIEPFPITGAGKIMKNELRAPYWINKTRAIN